MDKKYIWILVLISVVIAVAITTKKEAVDQTVLISPIAIATISPSPSPSPKIIIKPTKTPDITPELDYSAALQKYGSDRVQFDAGCQGSPSKMTVKNGTSVMFDNRSGDPRWISLDSKTYYVNGYGFRILTLASNTLPHTTTIGCGSAQGVAQILIQQ